jgi:nitroreductase
MLQALSDRRTCRSFDPTKPIPRNILEQILSAGLNAPTGMNSQVFDFYIVTRPSSLSAISASAVAGLPPELASFIRGPESILYGAPAAILLVPARKTTFCSSYDLGIISESIAVAAAALGLGSVILGIVRYCQAEALKQAVGPAVENVALGVGIGYAAADWSVKPRELTTPIRYVE